MVDNYQTLLIAAAAFLASMITFFSGFGLGTILTPVFALFFPLPIAIGLTAIVHLLNNLFKLVLTFKNIDQFTLIKFGLPAFFSAILGASLLTFLDNQTSYGSITLLGNTYQLYSLNLTLGTTILVFVLIDLIPSVKKFEFKQDRMVLGGFLSGFFGGLSGHQGALRSMFLMKGGLSKEVFIATGIAIACLIDLVRIPLYIFKGELSVDSSNTGVLFVAIFFAFLGAYIGNKYLKKVTLEAIQYFISFFLIIISLFILLGMGH
jgi:uncharacterized membrane protein YfcA